ncbi:protein NRD1 [Entomortierella parvispora]|uniref:Protein NRD1 n=1 Tax=Entomortierella parvispora TaxID=205924 RepID=A0A9P3M047_9FUNG|nr:protein NRD1 [Entomortierella parvispora]
MSKDASKEPQEVTDFNKELYSLFDSKSASASKIERITKMAIKSAKHYKNIVYLTEKFITRCVPEYKLTGLYVLDSICRTSHSIKQKGSGGSLTGAEYVGRFEKNIEALFAEFCKVQEDKEKEKVKRVVEIWDRSSTFSTSVVENIRKTYFPLLETKKSTTPPPPPTPPVRSPSPQREPEQSEADKAASLISSLAASLAQNGTNLNISPLTSEYTSSAASTAATAYPTPATSLTSTGIYPPYSNSPVAPSDPRMPKSAGSPAAPTANASAFLSGIADPSSALALQTLLATVSHVNAATASTTASPYMNTSYSQPTTPQVPSDPRGSSQTDLPPVLQQLQGFLSNSYTTNQEAFISPNNNSMMPTHASSSSGGVDSSSFRSGGGGIKSNMTSSVGPAISSPISSNTFGLGGSSSGRTAGGTNPGPPAVPLVPGGPMTHPLPPRPAAASGAGVGATVGGAPMTTAMAPGLPARDPRARVDSRLAARDQAQTPPNQPSQQPQLRHALPPPPTTRWPLPPTPGASSTTAGPNKGSTAGGQVHPLPPPPHLSGGMQRNGSTQGIMDQQNAGIPQRPMSQAATFMNGSFNTAEGGATNGMGRGNQGPRPMDPRGGGGGGAAAPQTNITVEEDPSVGPDQIRVISRTLWVGGTFIPTITERDLEAIFTPKGPIATLMVNQAKFNAFIKMVSRTSAEVAKRELNQQQVQGETMKVGWGCGFGPRDCFDYSTGTSVIPLDKLTDTDRRWLSNSVVGGFGPMEPIRGGVRILEPNIEAVGPDGREALATKRGGPGGERGGRGRGRGRGGPMNMGMDHQSFAAGSSTGANQFQLGKRDSSGDYQQRDSSRHNAQGDQIASEARKKTRWESQ